MLPAGGARRVGYGGALYWGRGYIGFCLMAFFQGFLFRGGLNFMEPSSVTILICTHPTLEETMEP